MAMSSHQVRVLREISEQLAADAPRLARRLCAPLEPPASTLREVAVMAALLGWMVLGFVPLALGIVYADRLLVSAGALTAFGLAPTLGWATLRWVHRHRFVRFRDPQPPP
jgi:hypothetical protein